jgi:signal transduction histidine kinase
VTTDPRADLSRQDSPAADVMLALLEELEQRNVSLEQANADLRHFAEIAAHDLRSPLTVVRGYLEQALRHDSELSPQTREWLDHALAGAKQVGDLVLALLAHSTSSGGELVATDVELGPVFGQARDHLREAMNARGATVTIGALPTVRGDRDLLTLVAQNLLENALKFTADGVAAAVDVSATVRPAVSGLGRATCAISVRDNGIGIAPAERDRVFMLFGRGAHTGRPGHGIGLATCARIVARHHGRLYVADSDSTGTVMVLEMPVSDPSLVTVPPVVPVPVEPG